jgi:CheY-like chemotaxis protein
MGAILIVDDEEDIRDDLAEILAVKGYSVVSSCNGREALARLRAGPAPAVILLDMRMPVMNGEEFLQAQEQDPQLAQIPVIICSGSPDTDVVVKNSVGHLRKPFELSQLLSLVAPYR